MLMKAHYVLEKNKIMALTHDWMIYQGFEHIPSKIIDSYTFNIAIFPQEYKAISVSIEKGNQYVYIRNGELNEPREEDQLICIFNSDTHGELTKDRIELILEALKVK